MPIVTMKHAEHIALGTAIAMVLAVSLSGSLFSPRQCYLGEPVVAALALMADLIIGISYILIWGTFLSVAKIMFTAGGSFRDRKVKEKAKDFTLALWVTSAFVLLCGMSHLSSVLLYAYPGMITVILDLAIRGCTAFVSVGAYLILAHTRRLLIP